MDINNNLFESLKPGTITPTLAFRKHGKAAIGYYHKDACDNTKKQCLSRLERAIKKLPEKPMSQIKESFLKQWPDYKLMSQVELQELRKFWEYCLLKKVCLGNNPIHATRKKRNKGKANKKNIVIDKLLAEQSQDLYDYIALNTTGPRMGTLLIMGAGFEPKKVIELKWSDLIFISDNYVIVKEYKPQRAGATKTYNRPIMPQAARLITKRRNHLLENYSLQKLNKMPIVSTRDDPTQKYSVEALKMDIKRLLRKYINYESMKLITNEDLDFAAPFKILKKTYEYDLKVRCSLESDPGVYKFMLGKSLLNDTTSDSYRSFTSPAGLRHLHELTRFLDREIPSEAPGIESTQKDGATAITLNPDTNHCTVSVFAEIDLTLGGTCEIHTSHGINGHIEWEYI